MMAIEYKDGTFGEPRPLEEILPEIPALAEADLIKALHVGTKEELEQKAQQPPIQEQIDQMKARLDQLSKPKSSIIKTPSDDDIKRFAQEAPNEQ